MDVAFLLGVIVLGLIAGSFVSVLVYRVPRGESIVWGRSHCRNCKHRLGVIDLIPVFSFLSTGGTCRYCKTRLSSVYPIIELTTGLLFVVAFWLAASVTPVFSFVQIVAFFYYAVLFTLLSALIFIDLRDMLLPDVLVFSALLVILVYQAAVTLVMTIQGVAVITPIYNPPGVVPSQSPFLGLLGYNFTPLGLGLLTGFCIALAFFLLIVLTRGKGMGGGDVKFALVLGAVTGWPNALVALFGAFLSGAIVSIFLLLLRKKHFGQTIPFGPFLILSTIATLVYGDKIVAWFLYDNHFLLI